MTSFNLSAEARMLLGKYLAQDVVQQVRDGLGQEPMPDAWTELHRLTLTAL